MRLPKRLLQSIGAIFHSRNSVPGTIYLEEASNPNFTIKACSAQSVTIDVAGDVNHSFERGHILAYIGSNNDDISICGHCHTLFRKIVAQGEDPNTYITEFASFADVFPDGAFDDSLAESPIEPMLACDNNNDNEEEHEDDEEKPSNHGVEPVAVVPVSAPDKKKEHRFLDDTTSAPTSAPTVDTPEETESAASDFCVNVIGFYFTVVGALFGCCGIPCVLLGAFILAFFNPCGYRAMAGIDPSDFGGRMLREVPSRMLQEVPSSHVPRMIDHALLPTSHDDWMKTDVDGNCLFVDCNVGPAKGKLSHCFRCGSRNDVSCSRTTCRRVSNEMISLPTSASLVDNFDFDEACNIQDICYSSNFEKAVCDENFYKTLQHSCSLLGDSTGGFVDAMFPLSESDLSQNCNLLSILLYTGVKHFGYDAYEEIQLKQHEHQETFCSDKPKMMQL